jgi:hypothetical protein
MIPVQEEVSEKGKSRLHSRKVTFGGPFKSVEAGSLSADNHDQEETATRAVFTPIGLTPKDLI